jgi:hypothetical protein
MRKTARPVAWEGAEAQSSAPDPICGRKAALRWATFQLIPVFGFNGGGRQSAATGLHKKNAAGIAPSRV